MVLEDDPAVDEAGRLIEMEVDYWDVCDEKIPYFKKLATEGKIHEALDGLLALEKQTRTASDVGSTGRLLVAIVQICREAHNWNALNEHILLLCKRRSQMKQAVSKMVKECATYVDIMPDKETKVKFIDTLRTVTEGKIYVEVERARLTYILAKMKEEEGNINEAANIIQELQVETYGSMEKREKVELILEQMRLCLAKKDYIRTQIIAKKINTKFFQEENTHDLKLKYYKLMIELDQHEGSYLATCKHYCAVLDTAAVREDPLQRAAVLQNVVLHLVLAPYDNEQSDLTHRVLQDRLLEEVPPYRDLLRLFINPELIKWSALRDIYEKELKVGSPKHPPTDVFNPQSEEGQKRWKDLKNRVVAHNIRVMAKYYTRITMKRMSELLDLPVEETEEFLSNLVVSKTVEAKTDRPAGIVNFTRSKDPNDILNEWSAHLSSLMQLVNQTTHLINKEEMVHKHLHLLTVKE